MILFILAYSLKHAHVSALVAPMGLESLLATTELR